TAGRRGGRGSTWPASRRGSARSPAAPSHWSHLHVAARNTPRKTGASALVDPAVLAEHLGLAVVGILEGVGDAGWNHDALARTADYLLGRHHEFDATPDDLEALLLEWVDVKGRCIRTRQRDLTESED